MGRLVYNLNSYKHWLVQFKEVSAYRVDEHRQIHRIKLKQPHYLFFQLAILFVLSLDFNGVHFSTLIIKLSFKCIAYNFGVFSQELWNTTDSSVMYVTALKHLDFFLGLTRVRICFTYAVLVKANTRLRSPLHWQLLGLSVLWFWSR